MKNKTEFNHTSLFASERTQKYFEFLAKSLLETKSPDDLDNSVAGMSRKQRELLRKVIGLLKDLKKNLCEEIKTLRSQILSRKQEMHEYIENLRKEIVEKKKSLADLKRKIQENEIEILRLSKKIEDCSKGKEELDACTERNDRNMKFLDSLREEKELIQNLLELIENFK